MRYLLTTLFFFAVSTVAFSQGSINDLLPAHAAELNRYLSANSERSFRSEHILSADYLKDVRGEWGFGAKFKPNYVVGDFNQDGLTDFALLLRRNGKETWSADLKPTERVESEHEPLRPLTLVIFNGLKGGRFRVAFTQDLTGPNAGFISITTNRRKKVLYYGVFETDSDTFTLVPKGTGYTTKSE